MDHDGGKEGSEVGAFNKKRIVGELGGGETEREGGREGGSIQQICTVR